MKKKIPFLTFFILALINASGQFKKPEIELEYALTASSGDKAPFWLVNNQYAQNSLEPFHTRLNTGIFSEGMKNDSSFFDYAYGFEFLNRYDGNFDPLFHQYYLQARLWFLKLRAGAMEEFYGNQDPELSSGSLLWSKNTRPMPKLSIETDGYTDVPFTFGYLEFKGGISHGWFEQERHVKNAYMHHKYLLGQLGGDLPINAHYGLHHYAQWGGEHPTRGKIPSGLEAFIKTFFAQEGDTSINPNLEGEAINVSGNHIGSRNIGMDIKFSKFSVSTYWQTIFEDNSGMVWRNIRDGLWGISLKQKDKTWPVHGICYEFVNTTDQSGPSHNDPENEDIILGGNDNYFNNYIYNSGWTYFKYSIGTPLITSPLYNEGGKIQVMNNKITAHHFGLQGGMKQFAYTIWITHSINHGRNGSPYEPFKTQTSILGHLDYRLKNDDKTRFFLDIGIDRGELLGKQVGTMIGVKKSF